MCMIMATMPRESVTHGLKYDIFYYKITHNGKILWVNQTNKRWGAVIPNRAYAEAALRHIELLAPKYKGKLSLVD